MEERESIVVNLDTSLLRGYPSLEAWISDDIWSSVQTKQKIFLLPIF